MGSHTIPGEAPTKEFFVIPHRGQVVGTGFRVDGVGDYADIMMLVPQDFSSITSLEIIFLPLQTAASMHFGIRTRYGAYNGGENHHVHTETEVARDIGATVSTQNLPHDISDLVDAAALAAGDLLGVYVYYNATAVDSNADVRMLRLKYT